MMKALVSLVLAILLLASSFVTAQASVTVPLAELAQTAIAAGDFKITIKSTGKGAWAKGPSYATIEVENTGKSPALFDPQRLSFVDANGQQFDVLFVESIINGTSHGTPRELLIIGGAKLIYVYNLNGLLLFPARLYYQGALLAEITK